MVDWSKSPSHAHYFKAQSTESYNHTHIVEAFTFNVNGSSADEHVHHYTGITSISNNHYHRFYGKTGPPIRLENGGHYHKVSGRVFFNYNDPIVVKYGGVVYHPNLGRDVHEHKYEGKTSEGIGYFPEEW